MPSGDFSISIFSTSSQVPDIRVREYGALGYVCPGYEIVCPGKDRTKPGQYKNVLDRGAWSVVDRRGKKLVERNWKSKIREPNPIESNQVESGQGVLERDRKYYNVCVCVDRPAFSTLQPMAHEKGEGPQSPEAGIVSSKVGPRLFVRLLMC